MTQEKVDKIKDSISRFYEELNYEIYLNYAGFKDTLNTSSIYEKYSFLMNKELALKIKNKDRGLNYISSFIQEMYINNKVSKIKDKIATLEANSFIEHDGKKINYRMIPVIIANESRREFRKQIYEKGIKCFYPINKYYIKLWKTMHDISKELGYRNYLEYCSFVNLKDYEKLKKSALEFLAKTKSLYVDLMSENFKKMNLDFYNSERHDLAFLFRATKFDHIFSKERMLELFNKFLDNFGLSLNNFPNIILDIEFREKKVTRAFVSPVKIPDKIYLVITPKGGQDDYLALFHEAGHAFHFANISKDLSVEYKYLGPSSVTEAFAFLFEYLLIEKEFLKKYLDLNFEYLKFQYLYKLYFLRRYCSKLIYEIELNTKGIDMKSGFLYKNIMEQNMITKHRRVNYLNDIDPGMYTAEYLEAWFFESQLKRYLKDKYGEDWFVKKEARDFLIKIWNQGFKYTLEEISRELGYKGIEVNYVYEEILEGLGY